jgi:two-component system cell cycle sensor histidine kinase/response regulator CckA
VGSLVPTVLAVDDDERVLALMARALATEHYDVLTARNGVEALAIAVTRVGEIQLVITDIQMPGMNGLELAARLAHLAPAPQVVFVSGYATTVGKELPGPFLAKPFGLNDLLQCVREILRNAEDRSLPRESGLESDLD